MSELFDKLLLRAIFAFFLLLVLFAYKYIHVVFYPHSLNKLRTKFDPSENPAETLHLFSRILGLGIIFSEFHLYIQDGLFIAFMDFVIKTGLTLLFFLSSIYVVESIIFYDVEYKNEIVDEKRSLIYAMVSGTHALGTAFVIKSIGSVYGNSIVVFLILWSFSLVLMGLALKVFMLFVHRSVQNLPSAVSYIGFFGGCSALLYTILRQPVYDLQLYAIDVVLKILLCLIVFPVFFKVLDWAYRFHKKTYLKESVNSHELSASISEESKLGQGLFQGISFFTSALFTIIVTENISFGKTYFLP